MSRNVSFFPRSMAVPISPESYTPHLNEEFVLHDEAGAAHVLTLKTVDRGHDNEDQFSFSLVFAGATDVQHPQKLYRLSHPRLGEIDLFLVPIRRKRDGIFYEAVFNLLKDEAQ